ncbi:MAG: translocation/assembly module TamB domain-containing protein [Asticcacaulis sp.]
MNMHLVGTTQNPRGTGRNARHPRHLYLRRPRLHHHRRRVITFDGGALTDPQIQLTAEANVNDITGLIKVSGSAQHPDIAFTSTPALPQDEVLSRILFGESVANISATEALQLASRSTACRGGTDYLNPLGRPAFCHRHRPAAASSAPTPLPAAARRWPPASN